MSNGPENLQVLRSWSEVPRFGDEAAEADFWLKHSLDPKLMNASVLKGDARESATVTLRFDPRLLARLKRVARSRYLNYQSMIKQWLAERLEEEKDES
jgi:predicted DNA binding CopG/RHH family protein